MATISELPLYPALSGAVERQPRSTDLHAPSTPAEAILRSRMEKIKLREFVDAAERYRPQLIWLATRITNRAEEAEDIVQQALLKAFRKLSGFRGESQMRTWLNAIVKNTAREYMRSQRGKVFVPLESSPFPDEASEELEIPDHGLSPEEYCEGREREEIVTAAIGGMGHANRQVLELCLFQELPYMQVATALNISLSTVKSRMFRSRRDLRLAVSNYTGAFR